jgi:DNA-binding response OmpR family regulator
MKTILLLEDDKKLADSICQFLETEHFVCQTVADGQLFLNHLGGRSFDLYILDINVPTVNGLAVCRKLRMLDKSTPILVLSAYHQIETKVEGLNAGADDYLMKPFHFEELLARIKALLRRNTTLQSAATIYEVDNLRLDTLDQKVWRNKREIHLTPKEYKLLEMLVKADGATVSKQRIAEEVWDINFETGTNTIEVYISFLRNKVDKGHTKPLIHTRPGFGYYLKEIK